MKACPYDPPCDYKIKTQKLDYSHILDYIEQNYNNKFHSNADLYSISIEVANKIREERKNYLVSGFKYTYIDNSWYLNS
tara:strand:+ start:4050 stop:4286 length:237 start_codon:yes stop_codon:yes gene_type:complete